MRILDRLANVVPLTDALDALATGRPLPPRAVALTFDDGYRDNLTLAAPTLRRFGMPATIYLVPHFLSGLEHPWWERLSWALRQATVSHVTHNAACHSLHDEDARVAALRDIEDDLKDRTRAERSQQVESLVDKLRPKGRFAHHDLFLDWEGAGGVVAAGLSVGSHSLGHAILARETPDEQRHDLRESRELLRRELQVEVETLAYPNGKPVDYDATTIDAARDAGYRYAVTTWGGPVTADDPPYEIHRTLVSPVESGARFAAKLVRSLVRPT
jgi:peptidoglycan/xylan/chitin deacetylase (PgdA/CDA1 family)